MRYSSRFVVILAVLVLFICGQPVHSQSTEKFEVGGQFTVLRTAPTSLPCVAQFCPAIVITDQRENQLGFGGRIGYDVTTNIALEAELNFFPDADLFPANELFGDGHMIQGLFGAKVGKRFEKVGIFAKARPGFLSASNGELQQPPETGCIAVFPPPAGCFEAVRKMHFALDLGGVFEVYPTKRTVIRFDVGDTILHLGERRVPVVFSPPVSPLVALPVAAETTHNFQASIGVAFRF